MHDFLFTYYSFTPAKLKQWLPPLGVSIEVTAADLEAFPWLQSDRVVNENGLLRLDERRFGLREREAEMPSPSPVPTTAASMPAPATEPTPVESKPPSAASSRASAPSPRSPAPTAEPAPIEPPSPGLEEEVAVLDRATAALREGDAAHALQWLAEHERQFPAGRLVDVRKATRVRALCRLGRAAQAETEAAALRREHPRSTIAQRTPLECEKS